MKEKSYVYKFDLVAANIFSILILIVLETLKPKLSYIIKYQVYFPKKLKIILFLYLLIILIQEITMLENL